MKVPGESRDYGDKGTFQATQQAIKYGFVQAFMIATGEPDADSRHPVEERELTPDEIADHLTNAAKLELFERIHVDGVSVEDAKSLASETWPLILKDAELFEIRTEADRDKALKAIRERHQTEDERPFE